MTKPHIASLILDLVGYTNDKDLTRIRLLEPSCGQGVFVVQAAKRLLASTRRTGCTAFQLRRAIRAYDIDSGSVHATRAALLPVLRHHGVSASFAHELVVAWIRCGDFLLAPQGAVYDVIVGNPPYIRIEHVPKALLEQYREKYVSLRGRADLYVAFIERSLKLLPSSGILSFICPDRWIANAYGATLRKMISERFFVHSYIDMHTTSPFESQVTSYPSIFVISRERCDKTHVIRLQEASEEECSTILPALNERQRAHPGASIESFNTWFRGDEPWIIGSATELRTLRALEHQFPPIKAYARIGVGVATGNDQVFIVPGTADIEPDRLVPLVMRDDIDAGKVLDRGRFVINTFSDGKVVDLKEFPRLARYLESHETELRRRFVARTNPGKWFRTIDRVYPQLTQRPKLLIPDIARSNQQVVLDPGGFHPHHNLYYIVSDCWDLAVLGGLLSSKVALLFVRSYAPKMRGGYLRFQAQYLRRIRLPAPTTLQPALAKAIGIAFRNRDFERLDELALQAYRLPSLPVFNLVDTVSLKDELRSFRQFGKNTTVVKTEVMTDVGWRLSVETFVNEFWTSKQRAAAKLHEVSYRACFKPQLPRFFIERLTRPGDVVYDPFMGRGTTLLEAALLKRFPAGCDVNPLSRILTRPRLRPPTMEQVASRLAEVDFKDCDEFPQDLLVFYHPETLREICSLKKHLLRREVAGTLDDIDEWIRMVALSRLTGHSRGFFSVYTLPPNQTVAVESQRKINAKRRQVPPRRCVPKLVLAKTRSLLSECDDRLRQTLARSLERTLLLTQPAAATPQIPSSSVQLAVTSPPFLDVVDYATDNWLRCWFCGIDTEAVPLPVPKRLGDWQVAMGEVFLELERILSPGGHVAFEVGEVRGGRLKLEEAVLPCGIRAGLEPLLVLINDQRFTKTANCWGVENGRKGTNTNRVVVFRKSSVP